MKAAAFLAGRSFGRSSSPSKDPMHTQRAAIPTISPAVITMHMMFDCALATHADVTLDGVRNLEAGEALTAWAASRGFAAVTSIVTPTFGSSDMRPYEVVRVQIGIARLAVLCARYVAEVAK